MTPDHALTGLAISAALGTLAALTILYATAHLILCHAIEAHRRLRHRHQTTHAPDHHPAATEPPAPTEQADTAHDPAATQTQAWLHAVNELDAACCERWWTTLATDHDPTCPNQTRKEAQ